LDFNNKATSGNWVLLISKCTGLGLAIEPLGLTDMGDKAGVKATRKQAESYLIEPAKAPGPIN
jgi:hypothetical protein